MMMTKRKEHHPANNFHPLATTERKFRKSKLRRGVEWFDLDIPSSQHITHAHTHYPIISYHFISYPWFIPYRTTLDSWQLENLESRFMSCCILFFLLLLLLLRNYYSLKYCSSLALGNGDGFSFFVVLSSICYFHCLIFWHARQMKSDLRNLTSIRMQSALLFLSAAWVVIMECASSFSRIQAIRSDIAGTAR